MNAKNFSKHFWYFPEWDCMHWRPWQKPDLQEAGGVLLLCREVGGCGGLLQEGDRAGQQGGHPQHLPQPGSPQQRPVQRGPAHHRASSKSGDMNGYFGEAQKGFDSFRILISLRLWLSRLTVCINTPGSVRYQLHKYSISFQGLNMLWCTTDGRSGWPPTKIQNWPKK